MYFEAFSRRGIGGDGDVVDVLIGEVVEIDVAGQPSSEATVGFLDAARLPECVSIAKSGSHGADGSQQVAHGRDRLGVGLAGELSDKRQA